MEIHYMEIHLCVVPNKCHTHIYVVFEIIFEWTEYAKKELKTPTRFYVWVKIIVCRVNNAKILVIVWMI